MSMLFHSTRGLSPPVDIRGAALAGLAPDGGLYVPVIWPTFSPFNIALMRGMSYADVAFRILQPFMTGTMPDDILRDIIAKSYGVFESPHVTPVVDVGDLKILELFHGPTLAFKDVALQFLGHTLEYFMRDVPQGMTIIGATSGDTGSAAIAALAGRNNINVFILYPVKGPSDIQRKQMTCVDAPNVHAMAVQGTFDDCQAIVKSLLADQTLRIERNLSTVNSINMLRILAQIPYYFYAASRVEGMPSFVVPTGNFGDIFAGYAAMKCGLPVGKLVVASNSNDILTRFFKTGRMEPAPVQNTLSPSMDIQISSNFERLLFDLCGQNAEQLRGLMDGLKNQAGFGLSELQMTLAHKYFAAGCADDTRTLSCIADIHARYNYVLDPHTAVGVKVAQNLHDILKSPVICLATAHPAKFPDTVKRAINIVPPLPEKTAALMQKPERTVLLPADKNAILKYMKEHA